MNKVTVIIPAYNEANRIKSTIDALKNLESINEIIVIDDGSTDETFDIAKSTGINVFKTPKNAGKGEALNFGIKKAAGDIIVLLDADLGESAKEASKLIVPLISKETDVTIAKFPKAKRKGGFGFVKRLSRFGVKHLTGQIVETVLSGQRGFKKEVLDKLPPFESGYGVELGMTVDILRLGYSIKEVEVNMTHAETGRNLKGFIHRGKQFWHILKVIIKRM
jgi:glycosyltransferase involved in cell wall biosynthesis